MTNKFKVCLIGCGAISVNHLEPLTANPNVEIVGLCDIKPERAESCKSDYNIKANIYTDYKKMIDCEKPDSVHIATPHYLHCEMALYALENDINVFLEKPMCINYEEIDKLLKAEKESKGKITVCFQNRFNRSTTLAKELADDDGGPISVYGSVFWDRNKEYYIESGWRGKMATEGGGVMINQAIHTLDLLCFFLGKPKKIWATKANHHLKGVIDVEDSCEGLIQFENGKTGNFYATSAFFGNDVTSVFIQTKNHYIEIKGSCVYMDDKLVDEDGADYAYMGKKCYGNGHKYLIDRFYNALLNNEDMPVTLESAQYALRILLAAYRSCDNETEV